MDLALYAVWCFLVALAGGLVGLVLGNLRLPATVAFASSPAAGAGVNLAISAVAAGTASIAHIRAGRINWRLVRWMAPPSVTAALIGGYVSGELPRTALLLVIAAVLFQAGISLLRWTPRPAAPAVHPDAPPPAADVDIPNAILSGLVIGFLGGVVGLILGSLRMPALLRFVGETPHRAVGTNVVVGFMVGIAGAVGHLPNASPDVGPLVVGALASIPGALLGSRLTGRLSEAALVRAIAVILLVVAAVTLAEALT